MEEIDHFNEDLVNDANQYLATHGIGFKEDGLSSTFSYVPVPVSLRPSELSKDLYMQIRSYQPVFNSMFEFLWK